MYNRDNRSKGIPMKSIRSLVTLTLPFALLVGRAAAQEPQDPFLWLEDIHSEKSMAWVNAHNQSTLADLEAYPAFDSIYTRGLAILNSTARIAYPVRRGNLIYNFWSDAKNPRGLWRRTTPASYLSGNPRWEKVLDIDSLSAAEKVTWAWKGADCLPPAYRRCLVSLSRGGGDAIEMREFDAQMKSFVAGGFFLPEAKGNATWTNDSTLLVATDFGPGTMTTSGYPRIAKIWHRGTPVAQAATIFEGKSADVSVGVGTIRVDGRRVSVVSDGITFFNGTVRVMEAGKLRLLDIPLDADFYTVGDQLVLYLRSDWKRGTRTYPPGALISIGYRGFLAGSRTFNVIVTPDARRTIESVTPTRTQLLVKVLDNVRSELHRYRYASGQWNDTKVSAPEFGDVSVDDASDATDSYFFSSTSFLQPTTLFSAAEDGTAREVTRLPAMFNATGLVVGQFEATSADGTHVPYFIVHRADMHLDGRQPTLLSAYGGFQVSLLPHYDPITGSAWLERGGVFVLANIRGGGEFGPVWHRAAQKENKQRSYDDFIAVALDLIARKVTSPAGLGIIGGSNGGLLVGAAFTQRPDLFGAVADEVPLLDMRRYTKMSAGASWIDEYGDPDVPSQWAYISKYSPYQNVFPNRTYPRVLFTTTTSDDRVGPAHARKMAAEMESMGYPVFFFENTEGGHGAGDTPEQRARMLAVVFTYLLKQLR
jgi:prolyl oligopeptidase